MFSTLARRVQTLWWSRRPVAGRLVGLLARAPQVFGGWAHNGSMSSRPRSQPVRLSWPHRLRAAGNAVNLSTLLGLGIAALGRARLSRGKRGLIYAEGFRVKLPAGAFTVGNVVVTHGRLDTLESAHPGTLDHEDSHAWQYLVLAGLPFLPLYAAASGWSWLRTGDRASRNIFERHAGLGSGGYHENPADWTGWRSIRTLLSRNRAANS